MLRHLAKPALMGLAAVVGVVLCSGVGCKRREPPPAQTLQPSPALEKEATSYAQFTIARWQGAHPVAIGPALAGPWRMNESEFLYVDDPSVALREDGSALVVWADNERKDLLLQIHAPDGREMLHEPVDISRSPTTFSWLPRIVLAPHGGVFVLWQEIIFSGGSHGGEILFARSLDGGRTFSPPLNLSNSSAGDGKGRLTQDFWDNGSLDLMATAAGELHAAWTDYGGTLWLSRSRDQGASFSPPKPLAGSRERPARAPALTGDRSRTLFIAWAVGEDAAAGIQLQRSDDGGESFEPVHVPPTGLGHADAPKIVLDDRGVLHMVFAQSDSRGATQVYYAQRSGSEFQAARAISRWPGQQGTASFPSLAVSGSDVLVLWHHRPELGGPLQGLSMVVSRDGGRTFAGPGMVRATADPALGVNGSRQGKLMNLLAVGDGGELAVVSSHFAAEQRSVVQLVRGRLP